ncbi:MAG: hypothetical protein KBE65_08100 [Phycisphaerae bacterium]|nr:hypothetical protein [Phycisphaerae bacterium]
MKNVSKLSVVFLVVGSIMGLAWANSAVDGDVPAIMVSPSTIVLARVSTVTVHTNIPAADVVRGSLALNGVPPTSVYVDDCGDIVAKFAAAKLGLTRGAATLTLCGDYGAGGSFSASDSVIVK